MNTVTAVRPSDSYLSLDVLLTGGLSILVCAGFWTFMDRSASVYTVAQFAFVMAFVCNHPHFLSSYVLLYGDYRHRIFSQKSYLWAAVVVPLILGGALATALINADAVLMAHVITAMYFLVGWHYVKQIFGCVIVSSVQRRIFYGLWQRRLLLFNLFTIWFMSWLRSHVGQTDFEFYGIRHYSLQLPAWTLTLVHVLAALSFAAVVWMQVKMYVDDGALPSPPAVAAFAAIYVWYLPAFSHPGFAYLVPFFHSLQYLAFVWLLKKNEVKHAIGGLRDRERRAAWIRKFVGFIVWVLVLGALAFEIVPGLLDARQGLRPQALGTQPFLVAFILFINIHHYFIDNVIWRSDNPSLRKYLFYTETENQPSRAGAFVSETA